MTDDRVAMSILYSSANYRQITSIEAEEFVVNNRNCWLDPEMPRRQYETVVQHELEQFSMGHYVPPYDVLVHQLRFLPVRPHSSRKYTTAKLLDVGASSGYYSQVIKGAGLDYDYTGLDHSPYYAELAMSLFGVKFIVADATNMSMIADRSYDVVITGGMLMHTLDYPAAIREIQRVADQQIIFHRTPIAYERLTRYFVKDAYGFPCLEIHFSEPEIRRLFEPEGWQIVMESSVTWDSKLAEGHVSYLCMRV